MNRKGFLAVLLALATSLTMLTACGSDDPEPEVKPSAGYFTYYLLTNAETLNAMQITNTLYTNEEVKTGIITADKCITLAEVTDPVAKAVLQNGLKSFGDKSNVLVYRAKFSQQSQPIVSLTYGLNFVPKTLDASTPEPNLGYGHCITFTPDKGKTTSYTGMFYFTKAVRKERLQLYADLQNSININRTQIVRLSVN